jgi:uncharacterized coiled-coil DUF342 family protein
MKLISTLETLSLSLNQFVMGQPQPKIKYTEDEMRSEIIEELSLVDPKTLRLVHSMMRAHAIERKLEEDPVVDYDENGLPVRASEFVEEADAIVEKMKQGAFVTLDELREKKDVWARATK